MSCAYWSQMSHSEIMSMHDVEMDLLHNDEDDFSHFEEEKEDECDSCPRCSGGGCNYCLMLGVRPLILLPTLTPKN